MSIADEWLQAIHRLSERAALPRVRAVHVPQDPEPGKRSSFCAVELEGSTTGLAYIALEGTRERLFQLDLQALAGADPLQLAAGFATQDGAARALGFATLNALARWLFDRSGFEPPHSRDSLGGIVPEAGGRIGMVGLFEPLVQRIRDAGAHLTVLELPPRPEVESPAYRLSHDPAQLRECSQVLCTSTVLLNDSFESLRAQCAAANVFVLIGPGASCLPDPLFTRGVTRLAGSWVLDPAGVFDALATGRSWSEHARKFELAPQDYPGFEALLARL